MTYCDAEYLYDETLKEGHNAFSYKAGTEAEEKLISSLLKKQPYPVHENLLHLLKKLPQVMTVYAAQEKAFLSEYSECPPSISELPLARMLKAYCSRIVGPDKNINVKFHKTSTSEIDAVLKDGTLICSQSLVQIEFHDEEQAIRAKLGALRSAERELRKCLKPSEQSVINFTTMKYVASAEFRTFLCPAGASPTLSLAMTEDSGGNTELGNQLYSCEDGDLSRAAAKRYLEVDREDQADASATNSTGGPSSVSKKIKRNPRSSNTAQHQSETTAGENLTVGVRSKAQEVILKSNPTQDGNMDVSKSNEDDYEIGDGHEEGGGDLQENEKEERGERDRFGHAYSMHGRAPDSQRMRFILGSYHAELTHKLIATPTFSVEQTFRNTRAADGEDNREISLNLGTVFPCCNTNEGDVVFTTSIRKQAP